MGVRYKVDKIGERANLCPTLMSTLKKERKNYSRNIGFFYLQDNCKKMMKL